jgi:hypothetical protein
MKSEEQAKIYEELHDKIMQITKSKAHDYAGADVLSNFKSVSNAAKELGIDVSNPTGYALFMVVLKLARLGNLISAGKTPNNESIDDSFLDGINYFKLAYCCYREQQEKSKERIEILPF